MKLAEFEFALSNFFYDNKYNCAQFQISCKYEI